MLRAAASQTTTEEQFWDDAESILTRVDEPIVKLAMNSATSYWQLFHCKKKFFLVATRPDPAEVRQARDELKLIAAVLETGWQLPELPEMQ